MPETTNKEAINQSVSFDAIRIGLASPEKIREWSRGDVSGKGQVVIVACIAEQVSAVVQFKCRDVLIMALRKSAYGA